MATAKKSNVLPDVNTQEGLREVFERAVKGDEAMIPAVRQLLTHPGNIEKMGGDLARCAERSFAKGISGDDLTVREAILAKVAEMKQELLGTDPTPLERLLADRIGVCWLQVQDAEIRFAQNQGKLSITQADYNLRRIESAQKRYLSAIKGLALVRKLALPALQINVAKKQINVVAPGAIGTNASV